MNSYEVVYDDFSPTRHRRDPNNITRSLCGLEYDWLPMTDDPNEVNCQSCLRIYKQPDFDGTVYYLDSK